MIKKDSKKGFALGAIFALLATLFGAVPAANATSGLIVAPTMGTSDTMVVTEPFALSIASIDDNDASKIKYYIEKPVGYNVDLSFTNSLTASFAVTQDSSSPGMANDRVSYSDTISMVFSWSPFATSGLNVLHLAVDSRSTEVNSASAAVDIKVTVWIDRIDDNLIGAGETAETYTVKFRPMSAFGSTITFGTPMVGDLALTASGTVSGVNFEQLSESFRIILGSRNDQAWTKSSAVLGMNGTASPEISSGLAAAGRISDSTAIAAAVAGSSVSALLAYGTDTLSYTAVQVSARTLDAITASGVVSSNLVVDEQLTGSARVNSAVAFQVWPYTGSNTAAPVVSAALTMTVSAITGLSTDKHITIEGVKYTSSADLPTESGIVLPAGKNTIDVVTSGFDGTEATTEFGFSVQNLNLQYNLDWASSTYTLENGDTAASTTPGSAVSLTWDIEDQWGVASTNPNHRVVAYWEGDSNFSASATSSFAVSGAKSTVTMTPTNATATGSTVLKVSLQTQNVASGLWTTDETEDVTVVVSALTGGFTSSEVATQSTSISYAIADGSFSWSPAYAGTTAVGGQDVVISGTSLYFKSSVGVTASSTLTIRAGSDGAFTFYAASGVSGTHTISMTAGGQTTTSLLVVSAPSFSDGVTMTIDKTEILAGSTTTITGKLVDANGNAVATQTTASIMVKWTGKGLPFNLPTQTDADGEFEFQVLALSSEVGEAAVSLTYMPTGSTTSTANKTNVYAVDIVSSLTAAPSADQKITVGTFKGYVAIYTKGYMGQKLSAKVAGKWLVVDPIAAYKSNDYSRTVRLTGAGYTITVDLYIDGAFVRSEVVTTK